MEMLRYFITKNCENCNRCKEACPEGAIYVDQDGGKYGINDNLCIGCGICMEVCPSGAVVHETDPYRIINREADSFFGGGAWPIPKDKLR